MDYSLWSIELLLISSIILVVSCPVHELGHLLCIRMLGDKRPKKVLWLGFSEGAWGYVTDESGFFSFPNTQRIKKFRKQIPFLIGASGGLFSATIFALISFSLFYFRSLGDVHLLSLAMSCFLIFLVQTIHGFSEGAALALSVELRRHKGSWITHNKAYI